MPGNTLTVGLKLSGQGTTVEELRDVWRIADDEGFDSCWDFDHFAGIGGDPELDVFEAWTMLAAMAEATKRVRIGCMVTGNTYRHPAVLAKTAVTVDHLSGGRLEFGIGAAWAEIEHTMLGIDYGTVGQRIARLDEACRLIKLLWTEDRASFEGRYYRLEDAIANPKPVQKPHPPIWIGGSGERKTLRVVAELADVWNAPGGDPSEVARLSGVLDRHCEDVGRDPATIRRSVQTRFDGDVDSLLRRVEEYVAVGIDDVIVMLIGGSAKAHGELAAETLPKLRAIG
ncbi:MAG TPA: LLM class F420-dependent oxidoreductase [Gaiellaceae bacterium]|nr:LLM class F420-dependent oxidoreductase [Gaiellaceae bacterium]